MVNNFVLRRTGKDFRHTEKSEKSGTSGLPRAQVGDFQTFPNGNTRNFFLKIQLLMVNNFVLRQTGKDFRRIFITNPKERKEWKEPKRVGKVDCLKPKSEIFGNFQMRVHFFLTGISVFLYKKKPDIYLTSLEISRCFCAYSRANSWFPKAVCAFPRLQQARPSPTLRTNNKYLF